MTVVLTFFKAYGVLIVCMIIAFAWAAKVPSLSIRLRSRRMKRLERLRNPKDQVERETFWDIAGTLLDDEEEPRLVEVCEELGWFE